MLMRIGKMKPAVGKAMEQEAHTAEFADLIRHSCDMAAGKKHSVFEIPNQIYPDKKDLLPDYLYKFFPCNADTILALKAQNLYFSDPGSFNDAYDCKVLIDREYFLAMQILEDAEILSGSGIITQEDIRRLKEDPSYMKTFRFPGSYNYRQKSRALGKDFSNRITDRVRVCCFANITQEHLSVCTEMWGHYAGAQKGFCVRYDLKKAKDEKDPIQKIINEYILGALWPCHYGSSPVIIPRVSSYNYACGRPLSAAQTSSLEKSILKTFTGKSAVWKYENEWRMILDSALVEKSGRMLHFPYADRIYLAPSIPRTYRDALVSSAGELGSAIYKCHMDHQKYKYDYDEINIPQYLDYMALDRESVITEMKED